MRSMIGENDNQYEIYFTNLFHFLQWWDRSSVRCELLLTFCQRDWKERKDRWRRAGSRRKLWWERRMRGEAALMWLAREEIRRVATTVFSGGRSCIRICKNTILNQLIKLVEQTQQGTCDFWEKLFLQLYSLESYAFM